MDWLKELHIINNYTGLFHGIMAIIALIAGTFVLLKTKGKETHKKIGYVYFSSMLALNIFSLFITNFGSFSFFHIMTAVSLLTIIMGILPAIRRKNDNWLVSHFYFMNWSVVGLYAALWAEIGVRFFDMRYFWWVVMVLTFLTVFIGMIIINKQAKKLNLNSK